MSIIGPRPQTQRCFNAFSLSSQHEIIKVGPGLSGIGSIIFRNEEDMMDANNDPDRFYDEVVMTYKGTLEKWYVTNQNIMTYFGLILATIWSVLRPNSSFIWLLFNNLPKPPDELKNALNYND